MPEQNAAVAIFATHELAEAGLKELQAAGVNLASISVVGKSDLKAEEEASGYYSTGDQMKLWGKMGVLWGGFLSLLLGSGFFFVPGIGPVVVAGRLVSLLIGALEGAAVVGGLSALGAALFNMGIPKGSVSQYEAALKSGKCLLLIHGNAEDARRAKEILDRTSAATTALHSG